MSETTYEWIDAAKARTDATRVHGGDEWKLIADLDDIVQGDLPKALDALRAVLDLIEMDRDDRAAPMRGYTPVVGKSSVRKAIATALGVTP